MIAGSNSRKLVTLAVIALMLSLAVSGCSKKPAVETDPTLGTETQPTEVIPTPPAAEPPEGQDGNAINRDGLEPSEYGVEDVFFAFDQYDLSDEAMAALANNARIMREAGVLILISGHCDERGTVEYNLALGEKRAKAVREYLISLGVTANKMLITSYGKTKPFADGHNERAWAQNRRAHFERP